MSRYPPLTQEQESMVTKMVELVLEKYVPLPLQLQELQRMVLNNSTSNEDDLRSGSTPHNPTRQYCYCFLVSREWNLPKAFEMLRQTVAYRAEHHLDGQPVFPCAVSCKGWDQDAIRRAFGKGVAEEDSGAALFPPRPTNQRLDRLCTGIAPYFQYGFHKWDKFGHPVLYMFIGRVDEPGLLDALKCMANIGQSAEAVMWEVVLHILAVAEWLQMFQQVQYNAGALKADAAEGIIRSSTVVIDLKGLTYKMLWKPALDLFMDTLKEIFKYYPQCMHQILLVNSPAMVMFAYKIVRGALPPGVQKKVHIANEHDTPETMKKFVEADCLPDFYGGTCHCTGGCIDGFDPTAKATETTDTAAAAAAKRSPDAAGSNALSENGALTAEFVSTEDISLKAGQQYKRVFQLKAGENVVWEFVSSDGKDVTFTKYFVPEKEANDMDWVKVHVKKLDPFVVSKENPSEGSDEYCANENGVLVLVWDNKKSWFTAKHLQMKVFKQCANSTAS